MSDGPFEDIFLTVAEVAERLRVTQQTVRNWIDRRQLGAIRVGRRVRVRQSEFDRFVALGNAGRGAAGLAARIGEPGLPGAPDASASVACDARDSFVDAVSELFRLLVTQRSGELVPALRRLARQAEHWADALQMTS